MWILTAMAVVAVQLLQLPGSKPSRAVFSPPLMYLLSLRIWFGIFFSEHLLTFLLLYRTKKIFWYKEMLLLRNMFHLYIVTKCYRLCKHEDDLCFQCNASLHRTAVHLHRVQTQLKKQKHAEPERPAVPVYLLCQPCFQHRCLQRGCNGDKNRLNCTSVHRSQPSCTQDWILVDDVWEKLLTLVSPVCQTKRQM